MEGRFVAVGSEKAQDYLKWIEGVEKISNCPSSQGQSNKNSNEKLKKADDKNNWVAKVWVVFLVVILMLGGVVIIRNLVRKKRK